MYAHLMDEFNKAATANPKRTVQKEWDDDQAAQMNGGGWRWPPWVVQLI